ncbi:DUF423 domain-containing protein [Phenylobacterium sp.]|uniref:DUF423 domain-containing protein n=1 Tax=Phenylobacterium sp. TaxID=1871053 RepID=UPI0025D20DE8|nr:DUF423 domain-containing protein [Phenylobacterium sp.]
MRGLPRRDWLALAALNAFVAIAMGAFAAHGISDPKAAEWLRTGAQYAFWHTMATFASAAFMGMGAPRARFAPAFFLTGSVIFAGSLYAMAFGAPRWLGAVTPIGGVLFLCGWAWLALSARDLDRGRGDRPT